MRCRKLSANSQILAHTLLDTIHAAPVLIDPILTFDGAPKYSFLLLSVMAGSATLHAGSLSGNHPMSAPRGRVLVSLFPAVAATAVTLRTVGRNRERAIRRGRGGSPCVLQSHSPRLVASHSASVPEFPRFLACGREPCSGPRVLDTGCWRWPRSPPSRFRWVRPPPAPTAHRRRSGCRSWTLAGKGFQVRA